MAKIIKINSQCAQKRLIVAPLIRYSIATTIKYITFYEFLLFLPGRYLMNVFKHHLIFSDTELHSLLISPLFISLVAVVMKKMFTFISFPFPIGWSICLFISLFRSFLFLSFFGKIISFLFKLEKY